MKTTKKYVWRKLFISLNEKRTQNTLVIERKLSTYVNINMITRLTGIYWPVSHLIDIGLIMQRDTDPGSYCCSFSECLWCSLISFLWYESCYSPKDVVIVWMLFISEFLCYSRNFVFVLWMFLFFWILLLFFGCCCCAVNIYVGVRVLFFCVCVHYYLRVCVIHLMFILFHDCCNSRNICCCLNFYSILWKFALLSCVVLVILYTFLFSMFWRFSLNY